jgi:hypothetical protein
MSKKWVIDWNLKSKYQIVYNQKKNPKTFFMCALLILMFYPVLKYKFCYGAEEHQVLTLDEAINLAIKNQPSIAAGRFTVKINEARIGEVLSAYYPQLSASASYRKISPAATSSSRSSGSSISSLLSSSTAGAYDNFSTGAGGKLINL